MFVRYIIRSLPKFTDWKGVKHPASFDVTIICSRGMRWDGGNYPTREEAEEAGQRVTKQVAA